MDAGHRGLLLHRRFQALLEEHFTSIREPADYARMLRTTERALTDSLRRTAGGHPSQLIRDRVTRLLDRAAIFQGYPLAVRTDNGPLHGGYMNPDEKGFAAFLIAANPCFGLVGRTRFELVTNGLKVRCSTN